MSPYSIDNIHFIFTVRLRNSGDHRIIQVAMRIVNDIQCSLAQASHQYIRVDIGGRYLRQISLVYHNRRSAGSVVDDHPEVVTIIKPKIPAGPGYRYLYILTEVDKHGVARTRAGLRAQDSIERKLRTLGHNGRKRQYHLRSTADHHRVIRVHNDEGN